MINWKKPLAYSPYTKKHNNKVSFTYLYYFDECEVDKNVK